MLILHSNPNQNILLIIIFCERMESTHKMMGRKACGSLPSCSSCPISEELVLKSFCVSDKETCEAFKSECCGSKSSSKKKVCMDQCPEMWPVGTLSILWSDHTMTCGTGTLVSSNVVLTSASNLYNRQTGCRYKTVCFTPCQNGLKGETFKVISVFMDDLYTSGDCDQKVCSSNYCLLTLDRSASAYGRLGVACWPTSSNCSNQKVKFCGYSGECFDYNCNEEGSVESVSKYLCWEEGKVEDVKGCKVLYRFQTSESDCGAPICYTDSKGDCFIVALHNCSDGPIYCSGLAISERMLSVIKGYTCKSIESEFSLCGQPPSKSTCMWDSECFVCEAKPSTVGESWDFKSYEKLQRVMKQEYPFSCIGYLVSKCGDTSVSGTGFIISKHAILTTCCNVLDMEKKVCKDITFYPGLNGPKGTPFKVTQVKMLSTPSHSKKQMNMQLAVLFVEENIQSMFGSMGLVDLDDKCCDFTVKKYTVAGYPICSSSSSSTKYQYCDTGFCKESTSDMMIHTMCTSAGSGGSPMFFKSESNDSFYCSGVHVGADHDLKFSTKITKSILSQIKCCVKEHCDMLSSMTCPPNKKPLSLQEKLPSSENSISTESSKSINGEFVEEIRFYDNVSTKVSHPDSFPYRVMGKVFMTYSDGLYTGTGTLISGNIVLTCGHNLYNRKTKEKPSEVKFSPAYSVHNGVTKGNMYKVSFFTVCPEYITSSNKNASKYDLGLMALCQDLSTTSGYISFECKQQNDPFWFTQKLCIVGYPGDLEKGKNQYEGSGVALDVKDGMIYHRIDTFGGNSGSCMFYQQPNHTYSIVGVHTGGYNDWQNGLNMGRNMGPKLTEEFVSFMKDFIETHSICTSQSESGTSQQCSFPFKESEVVNESSIDTSDFDANTPLWNDSGKYKFVRNNFGKSFYENIKPVVNVGKNLGRFKTPTESNILDGLKEFYRTQNIRVLQNKKPLTVCVQVQDHPTDPIDSRWSDVMQSSIDQINEAAPGLNLVLKKPWEKLSSSDLVIRFRKNLEDPEAAWTIHNLFKCKNPIIELGYPELYIQENKRLAVGTVTHEILHALGFSHEMKRSDIESGIHVYLDRIPKRWRSQYEVGPDDVGVTTFDPYSIMLYPLNQFTVRNTKNVTWMDKSNNDQNQFISELDKIALNIIYCPVVRPDMKFMPKEDQRNHFFYCGRVVHQNSDPSCSVLSEVEYKCCFESGRNCPACRVLKNDELDKMLESRNCWVGWSGSIYCFKDKKCGPNVGPSCQDCTKMYNGCWSSSSCSTSVKTSFTTKETSSMNPTCSTTESSCTTRSSSCSTTNPSCTTSSSCPTTESSCTTTSSSCPTTSSSCPTSESSCTTMKVQKP